MSGALQPECSLANAELVPSLLVLRVAAFKALLAQQRGALRTKSLHAEVVFNLAGSKHVSGGCFFAPHNACLSTPPCLPCSLPPPQTSRRPPCSLPVLQIAQSLDRFGINPGCRHLLAARFDALPEEEAQLQGLIAGAPTPLAELPLLTDQQLLIKHLKVTPEELLVGSLADAMLMRSAGRDC